MLKNLAYEALESIASFLLRAVAMILDIIIDFFSGGINGMKPTLSYFNLHVISGASNVSTIISVFQKVAGIILIFLVAWNFGAIAINTTFKEKDYKDTLRSIITRTMVCIILISSSSFVLQLVSDIDDLFYDYVVVEIFGDGSEDNNFGLLGEYAGGGDSSTSMRDSISKTNNDDYTASQPYKDENGNWQMNDSIGSGSTESSEDEVDTVSAIIIAIIGICLEVYFIGSLLYNYMKLVVELCRRYAKWCFMYLTYPLACSTYVCSGTENIFLNYLGGFANEGICLLATHVIMKLTNWFLHVANGNLITIVFIIGWINIGISLEQFMREHGFVIGSSGGSMLDNMLQSAHYMQSLGRNMRANAGRAMIGAAALTNSVGLGKAGALMTPGMKMDDATVLGAMRGSAGNAIGRALNNGNEVMSESKQKAMDRLYRQSGDPSKRGEFLSAYNMLGADDQAAYANHLLNDVVGKDNIAQAMGLSNGSNLDFENASLDSKGNVVATASTDMGQQDVTLGTDGNGIGFAGANGDQMHLSMGKGDIGCDECQLDSIIGSDIQNEDGSLDSNALEANPLSTLGGFDASDVNAVMDAHNDTDLSHYKYSNEDGISRIDYVGENGDSLAPYNGRMMAADGTKFDSAKMSSHFNGTMNMNGKVSDISNNPNDIRGKNGFNLDGDAPAYFARNNVASVHRAEYINGKDGRNGYKLFCNMKDGSEKVFGYGPASDHPNAVKSGATVSSHGGIMWEMKEKAKQKIILPGGNEV